MRGHRARSPLVPILSALLLAAYGVPVPVTAAEEVVAVTPTTTSIQPQTQLAITEYSYTIWATISPAPDGGSVQWLADGVVFSTGPVHPGQSSVVAFWTEPDPATVEFEARYLGTANFEPSASEPVSIEFVNYAITVIGTPSTSAIGAAVTFAATVTPNPGGGDMQWEIDGFPTVTSPVNASGTATLVRAFTAGGLVMVRTQFLGNGSFYPPWGGPNHGHQVSWDPAAFTVALPRNPAPEGAVSVVARVVPNPGGGSVHTYDRINMVHHPDVPLGPDGAAVINLGAKAPGPQSYEFFYTGFGEYGPDNVLLDFTVWDKTATTLVTNRTAAVQGELPVVLTASVTGIPAGEGPGNVTFQEVVGHRAVTIATVAVNGSTGKATLSTAALRPGTYAIRARYNGYTGTLSSMSGLVKVTVAADTAMNGTFAVSPTTFYPSKDSFRDTTTLSGNLNEKATVVIRIYDGSNVLRRTIDLGLRNPGPFSTTWNGRTAAGAALPAGKYRVTATLKDGLGHVATINREVTLSWRKAEWRSASVTRYAETGAYFVDVDERGKLYFSPYYPKGRILDAGSMDRDCSPCGYVGGRFTWTLTSSGLAYRNIAIEVRGHGFVDREHTGEYLAIDPATGKAGVTVSPYPFDSGHANLIVPSTMVSSSRTIETWIEMVENWGDAYDLNYLKLTYQYAVLQ